MLYRTLICLIMSQTIDRSSGVGNRSSFENLFEGSWSTVLFVSGSDGWRLVGGDGSASGGDGSVTSNVTR